MFFNVFFICKLMFLTCMVKITRRDKAYSLQCISSGVNYTSSKPGNKIMRGAHPGDSGPPLQPSYSICLPFVLGFNRLRQPYVIAIEINVSFVVYQQNEINTGTNRMLDNFIVTIIRHSC